LMFQQILENILRQTFNVRTVSNTQKYLFF